tara:strand:+ start:187 stop:516 length:330 start_codon:yes stop_codon:yes gene_type:complete
MIKSNYNQFEVAPTELPRVLDAFSKKRPTLAPSPSIWNQEIGSVLVELLETGRDESNFEKVLLDDFWGVYIINVDNRFLISEDDGMPDVHARAVKEILDNHGIKYQLNA